MTGNTAYALSKSYTDETVIGGGAIKGKNCTVEKIEKTGNTNTVTFKWTLDDGSVKTGTMKVQDGADALNIVSASFDANDHLIVKFSDGSLQDWGLMPQASVKVSKESGNALTQKTDGLYVAKGSVEISKDTDNALSSKADGLYVAKTKVSAKTGNIIKEETDGLYAKADEITISKNTDNVLTKEADGLYVPKADAQIQADFNQTDNAKADFIKNKPTVDQTYSATSTNAQSGKAVASAISTEIGKQTYLSKEIATKTEIDGYIADPTKAKFNIIYLLKDASAKGSDKYFEYQRIGNETSSTFEMTGDTSTDLTDYLKKNAIVKAFSTTVSDDNIASEKLVKDSLDAKVDIQQKVEDKGKALIVGEDGKVIPTEISTDDILANTEIKMLGWNVPKECTIQNTVNGNQFVQRVGRVDLGTLEWEYRSSDGLMLCQTPIDSKTIAETDAPNIYCNTYEALPRSGSVSVANTDKSIALPNKYIIVHDSGYADGVTFKAFVKDTYLYYELATPITTQIDGNEILNNFGELSNYTDGFVIDELKNISANNDYIITDFIPVNDTDTYTIVCGHTQDHSALLTYDAGKNVLGVYSVFDRTIANFVAGTRYIRVSFTKANMDKSTIQDKDGNDLYKACKFNLEEFANVKNALNTTHTISYTTTSGTTKTITVYGK